MLLQAFFFGVTVYGWVQWKRPEKHPPIQWLTLRWRLILTGALVVGTGMSWSFFSRIHVIYPMWFADPTAFPLADSFVMVASVMATALLAMKKMETWLVWIGVDAVCVYLYFSRGVYFLSFEYLIFLGLASYGLFNWMRNLQE
jgi:nicotinamide mononucleotide transporter